MKFHGVIRGESRFCGTPVERAGWEYGAVPDCGGSFGGATEDDVPGPDDDGTPLVG